MAVKTPVILISGFLGSGKTTLLLRMLHYAAENSINTAVLMNELGELDVDGQMLQEEMPGIAVEKLLDGCICCSRMEEMADALSQLLERNPDVIVVETTGVADPLRLIGGLRHSPLLDQRVSLQSTVAVVDAEMFLDYNSIFASDRTLVRTLRSQISSADLLILNKTDTCDEKKLDKVQQTIRKYNAHAKLEATVYSRVNISALFKNSFPEKHLSSSEPAASLLASPEKPLVNSPFRMAFSSSYSGLTTVTLTLPSPFRLEQKKIEGFLSSLGPGLLRAKGFCVLPAGPVLLQYAGAKFEWKTSRLPVKQGYITLIGSGLNKSAILAEWDQLLI